MSICIFLIFLIVTPAKYFIKYFIKLLIGHTEKECLNLLSSESITKTDIKKDKRVEKRKAENEFKKSLSKKSKIEHSKEVIKQNVPIDRKKVLKLKQIKKKLSRIKK